MPAHMPQHTHIQKPIKAYIKENICIASLSCFSSNLTNLQYFITKKIEHDIHIIIYLILKIDIRTKSSK